MTPQEQAAKRRAQFIEWRPESEGKVDATLAILGMCPLVCLNPECPERFHTLNVVMGVN